MVIREALGTDILIEGLQGRAVELVVDAQSRDLASVGGAQAGTGFPEGVFQPLRQLPVGIRLRGGVKIAADEDRVGAFLDFCYHSFLLKRPAMPLTLFQVFLSCRLPSLATSLAMPETPLDCRWRLKTRISFPSTLMSAH